jgi:ketosteroid isomerase-like protein
MKRLLTIITIFVLLAVPQFALASDLDDFKAEVDKFVQAFNSLDANAIAQTIQPGLVVFDYDSPFSSVYPDKTAVKESMQKWFSNLESLNIVLVEPQYNVVGNTGVMWGYETSTSKPKDGPSVTIHYRVIMTYIKSEGKWCVLTIHLSYLPPGKP